MRPLTITLFCLLAFCELSFALNSGKNLSTTGALEKYGYLLKKQTFLVFPELRESPLKWFDSIPNGKIEESIHSKEFVMSARSEELFVFQLGVWALEKDITDVQILFSNLKDERSEGVV